MFILKIEFFSNKINKLPKTYSEIILQQRNFYMGLLTTTLTRTGAIEDLKKKALKLSLASEDNRKL